MACIGPLHEAQQQKVGGRPLSRKATRRRESNDQPFAPPARYFPCSSSTSGVPAAWVTASAALRPEPKDLIWPNRESASCPAMIWAATPGTGFPG